MFYMEIIFKQQLELRLIFILSVMCVMDAEAELKSASVHLRFLFSCAVAPGDESQFDLNDNLMLSLKSFSNCQECIPSAQGQIIFPKQAFIYLFVLSNYALYLFSLPISIIHTVNATEIRKARNGERYERLHFLFALMNY